MIDIVASGPTLALAAAIGTAMGWGGMTLMWRLSLGAARAERRRLEAWERGEPRDSGVLGWFIDALARREIRRLCARLPSKGDLLTPGWASNWLVMDVHLPDPPSPSASVTLLRADDPAGRTVVVPVLHFLHWDSDRARVQDT